MKPRFKLFYRRAVGLSRVLLLLLAAALALLFFSVQAASAHANDAMLQLGRHLATLSESGLGKDARAVVLNGQHMGFRVFTAEQELSTTLDFYQSWCHGDLSDFPRQESALRALEHSELVSTKKSRSWKDLVVRSSEGETGYVACLKHGMANASSEELGQRLQRFAEGGNLADLGQFHYAAVTQFASRVRVVVLWTEGDFHPTAMFPEQGDAPGFDPPHLPRPSSGRRILSAGEAGETALMTVYSEIEESVAGLRDFYRRALHDNEWQLLHDEATPDGGHLYVAQRGSEMRALHLSAQTPQTSSVVISSTR